MTNTEYQAYLASLLNNTSPTTNSQKLMAHYLDAMATPAPKAAPTPASSPAAAPSNLSVDDNIPQWANNDITGPALTTLYSMGNSALFGIPGWAAKTFAPDVSNAIDALRNKYKFSTTVGDIGGAFLPTGGALFKGAGKAAELVGLGRAASGLQEGAGIAGALTKAGDIVKGAPTVGEVAAGAAKPTLLTSLARGALAGSEQAVPRMLTGQQDANAGLVDIAGGAAAGGLGYGLSQAAERLPEALTDLRKWGSKTMLKRADISPRDLRAQATNYMGGNPEKLEDFMKNAAEEVRDKQLFREPLMEDYVGSIRRDWNNWSDAWTTAAEEGSPLTSLDDLLARTKADPDAVAAMSRLDARQAINPRVKITGDSELQSLAAQLDATPGLAGKRAYLASVAFSDTANPEVKTIARAMRDSLDEQARATAGITPTEWTQMKADYPLKSLLQKGDVRAESSLAGAGIQRGSDTAAKLALSGLGSAVGGAAAGGSQLKGVIDDPADPNAWARFLTATLGGAVVGGASKTISNVLARAAMRLDPEDLSALAQKIGLAKSLDEVHSIITPIVANLEGGVPAAAKLVAQAAPSVAAGEPINVLGNQITTTSTLPQTALGEAPQNAQAAAVQNAPQNSAYLDFVEQKLWNRFIGSGQASRIAQWASLNGKDPQDEITKAYTDFLSKAYHATGGYQVEAISPYIFNDAKEAAIFQRISKTTLPTILDDNTLKTATSFGIFGGARAPEDAMSNILIALDAAGVPSSLGGVPIRKYVDNILRMNRNDQLRQKVALISLIKNQSTLEPTIVDAALAAGGLA